MKDQLKTIRAAYMKGWIRASAWANRDDLIADIDSPAYTKEALTALSELEQMAGDQEPEGWSYMHEETGRHMCVSNDGINTPDVFLEHNPRWSLIGPLFSAPPAQQPQAEWIDGVPHWTPELIAKVKRMAAELDEPKQPQAAAAHHKPVRVCHIKDVACSEAAVKCGECPDAAPQQAEAVPLDMGAMELAESVGLIGPASRTDDFHAAIQRFHDLISMNVSIKAAVHFAQGLPKKGGAA